MTQKEIIELHDPSRLPGKLKLIAGSLSDDWNNFVANQTANSLWRTDAAQARQDRHAAVDAMIGIGPNDEIEGMIAAQLIACHNAAMECYRRAMLGQQTFEGRRENLNQANKLSRTYTSLVEALNRHRGKGQQKVTVEHVHVHSGGQAIVGHVNTQGGVATKSEEQPHAKPITDAPEPTMRCPNPTGQPMSVASDAQRPL
jgi:hypothetical protein